jgi:hypothetical protein
LIDVVLLSVGMGLTRSLVSRTVSAEEADARCEDDAVLLFSSSTYY